MARINAQQTFKAWHAGKRCRKAQSVWTDGKTIYSYGTPIVKRLEDGSVSLNVYKYSPTTSAQQNGLRSMLEDAGYRITFVEG